MARYAIALSLVLAASVMATPSRMLAKTQTADRPTWTMGDTWSYQEGDETATWRVFSATQDGYAVELKTAPPARTYTFYFDRNLIFSQALYFHPKWPMALGDRWSYSASGQAFNGIGGDNFVLLRSYLDKTARN